MGYGEIYFPRNVYLGNLSGNKFLVEISFNIVPSYLPYNCYQLIISYCFKLIKRYSYSRTKSQSDHHEEEEKRPERRQRHLGQSFRVDHEYQSRTWIESFISFLW